MAGSTPAYANDTTGQAGRAFRLNEHITQAQDQKRSKLRGRATEETRWITKVELQRLETSCQG